MLLRHTLLNVVGLGAPLLAAVATIPALVDSLGDERFGLLTLIWAVVGYFSLFDLGLGRALTMQLSSAIARGRLRDVMPLVATALALMFVLGVAASLILALGTPWGVAQMQSLHDPGEAIRALHAMAWSLPFIVLTSGLRGILEARHEFFVLNALRLPLGVFTFAGPWAVVVLGYSELDTIGWVLTAARVAACIAHAWFAWRALPASAGHARISAAAMPRLFAAGGWITVSSLVSPLMTYADRFIVGALVSASAVAYFATPQEIVTKIWIVPAALTAVLFPRFAAAGIDGMAGASRRFLWSSVGALLAVVHPMTLVMVLFAGEILTLWISPEFSANSRLLLQCFAIGILLNVPAHVPFTLLQAVGRARAVALIHLMEAPVFIGWTWWLTLEQGLTGSGIAWVMRCAIDSALMFGVARATMRGDAPRQPRIGWRGWLAGAIGLSCYGAVLMPELEWRVAACAVGFTVSTWAGFRLWRHNAEKST